MGLVLPGRLLQVLSEIVHIRNVQRVNPVTVLGRAKGVLEHSQNDSQRLGINPTGAPPGQQHETLREEIPVGRDGGQKQERIPIPDQGIEDPMILYFQALEEQGIVIRVQS